MEMSCSCCVENCFNNARSQPNLNFYILPSYKQQYWCWLQVIGPAEVDKKKILDKNWSPNTQFYVCSELKKTLWLLFMDWVQLPQD